MKDEIIKNLLFSAKLAMDRLDRVRPFLDGAFYADPKSPLSDVRSGVRDAYCQLAFIIDVLEKDQRT